MKNEMLTRIGTAAMAVLMTAAFTPILVSAQEDGKNALVGVWNLQVSRRNCDTGAVIAVVPAMLTFHRGGTMSDWGTGMSPSLRSPGQGIWNSESDGHYSQAFQFFRFNADGTLAGRQVNRTNVTLFNNGNNILNNAVAQIFDVNGNLIAVNCSTALGTRFQ